MSRFRKSNPMNGSIKNVIVAKQRPSPVTVPDMAWLIKDKEEAFCILIADGVPVAMAFRKAGFSAKGNSALALYSQPRIQERISAIVKARAATAPVSLPEITDMMKRVYAGSIHDCEYTPAYNAAFGLARLYGLVVDRAQLDVVRRPSREPDAPSEMALGQWIEQLPSLPPGPQSQPLAAHIPSPIGPGPSASSIDLTPFGCDLDGPSSRGPGLDAGPRADATGGEIGNEPLGGRVTGTPSPRAHFSVDTRASQKDGSPLDAEGNPYPRAEDLF